MENTFSRIKHILGEIPFFEDFSSDELDFFSRNVSLRYFPAQTVLFREGDIADYLFFVVEGMVDVRVEPTDSKQIIIATFDRGCCVGEMSIVDDYPRSATIVVTKPSELLLVTRNRFESICQENPPVGIKFLHGLARNLSMRLRKTTGRFADLA
ncbi:MAG: cyclic nucleotide-binding domain-containing protein [Deltaproteobacteria bacterium]|nr:cyclic nucleotide-binding domain-containing protein [Deltaproteobacteria bacterium]MBW1794759.1 cyclic nucleotide-binding domain-containing protein [Deltaproteobacteria bacterium]MBW2330473.1 cyclic nucleotide-binding domain-containing protein [Deltaproteobacteria bacterium]